MCNHTNTLNYDYESILLILLNTECYTDLQEIQKALNGMTQDKVKIETICDKMVKNNQLTTQITDGIKYFKKMPLIIKVNPNVLKKRHNHNLNENKEYTCEYCPYTCKKANTMSMHIRTKHSDDCGWESTIHNCKQCDKSFDMKSKLDQHVKRFHNVEKKQCPFCLKHFKLNGVYAHIVNKHITKKQKEQYPKYSAYKLGKMIYDQKQQK